MAIQFTQYLMPHGEKTTVSIERDIEVETKARTIKHKGFRFEIEMLRDTTISMTIENADGPIAHKLCSNGPAVPGKVDEMVNETYQYLIDKGVINGIK